MLNINIIYNKNIYYHYWNNELFFIYNFYGFLQLLYMLQI